jgi:hypothetical protein
MQKVPKNIMVGKPQRPKAFNIPFSHRGLEVLPLIREEKGVEKYE